MSYHPVKKIDVSQILYSVEQYGKINIDKTIDPLTKKNFAELIIRRTSKGTPYILGRTGNGSEMETMDGATLRNLYLNNKLKDKKFNNIFYFTIDNKNETHFNYIGKQIEANSDKKAFLNMFFDAQEGNLKALFKLAAYYENEQNFIQAAQIYKCIALQGNEEGLKKLDLLFQAGIADTECTIECYQILADKGNALAQFFLAHHLECGSELDIEKALKYYQASANQNQPDALLALIFHYAKNEQFEEAGDLITQFISCGHKISTKDLDERINELGDIDLSQEFAAVLDLLTS